MAELAAIAPVHHLDEVRGQLYHLALMHLTYDPAYVRFFADAAEARRFVILDNSQQEGYSHDIRDIARTADMMGASEIVIPDDVMSWRNSVDKAREAFTTILNDTETETTLRGLRCSWMVVPHGHNLVDWKKCCDALLILYENLQRARPDVLPKPLTLGFGISDATDVWKKSDLDAILALLSYYQRKYGCRIHILGWDRSPWEYVPYLISKYNIRSVDTAKPFSFALYDDAVPFADRHRPKAFFDRRFTEAEVQRAQYHLMRFRHAVANATEQSELKELR